MKIKNTFKTALSEIDSLKLFSEQSIVIWLTLILLISSTYLQGPMRSNQDQLIHWVSINVFFQLVIPVLVILFVFRKNLKDYGLALGKIKVWLPTSIIFLLVMLPLLIIVSKFSDFKAYYPIYIPARTDVSQFILFQSLWVFYMFSWEFIFRGFMLFALEKKFGNFAIMIQTIPFVLLHMYKPVGEVFGSIIAGIALGYLVLRSRSVLPAFLLHWGIAFILDCLLTL